MSFAKYLVNKYVVYNSKYLDKQKILEDLKLPLQELKRLNNIEPDSDEDEQLEIRQDQISVIQDILGTIKINKFKIDENIDKLYQELGEYDKVVRKRYEEVKQKTSHLEKAYDELNIELYEDLVDYDE